MYGAVNECNGPLWVNMWVACKPHYKQKYYFHTNERCSHTVYWNITFTLRKRERERFSHWQCVHSTCHIYNKMKMYCATNLRTPWKQETWSGQIYKKKCHESNPKNLPSPSPAAWSAWQWWWSCVPITSSRSPLWSQPAAPGWLCKPFCIGNPGKKTRSCHHCWLCSGITIIS